MISTDQSVAVALEYLWKKNASIGVESITVDPEKGYRDFIRFNINDRRVRNYMVWKHKWIERGAAVVRQGMKSIS